LGSDLRGAARRGHDLRLQLEYEEQLEAPLRAGTVVGTATLWDGERVVARAPLLVDEDVERDGWWQRLRAALLRVVKAAAAYGVG
jgi:D-alanyl-D-alanine carboxypeptidase